MMHMLQHFAAEISDEELKIPKPKLEFTTLTDSLQVLFGIFAAVAVLIIAISAFRIVISRGNSQDVQKARDSIIYASIGLAISMSAFAIVTFVVERV